MNAPFEKALTDPLVIGGQPFASRLLVGTGKYRSLDETARMLGVSGWGLWCTARIRMKPFWAAISA